MLHRQASLLGCLATLSMVAGCSMRMAQPSPAARPLANEDLRPAPEWVSDTLARVAPELTFKVNEHEPGEDKRHELGLMAAAFKEIHGDFPDIVVVIEGHCDDRGSTEYNLQLGKRRANSVQRVLVSLGVPAVHLRTVSFGDTKPLCLDRTDACRERNRRIAFRAEEQTLGNH